MTSSLALINMPILAYSDEIKSAVLVIHGEKAHSRYFGEDAFKKLKGDNKELLIVDGASHVDLYDNLEKIPFDKAPIEMNLRFGDTEAPDAAARFGIRLKSPSGEYVSMEYDKSSGTMVVDRSHATYVQFSEPFSSIQHVPYRPIKGRSTWKILIDAASMELFVDDGVLVFTNVFFPGQPFDTIELFTDGGYITVPDAPGLGIESLNEELIRKNLHPDFPEAWAPTSEWDKEWANDRQWS